MGYLVVFILVSTAFYIHLIGIWNILQSVFPIDLIILGFSAFLSAVVNFPIWVTTRLFVVIVSWLFEGVDRVAYILIWIFCSFAVFLGGAGFLYYHPDIQMEFYKLLSPVIPDYFVQVILASGLLGVFIAAVLIDGVNSIEIEEPVQQQPQQRVAEPPRVVGATPAVVVQSPVTRPATGPSTPLRNPQMPSTKAASQPIWLENLTLLVTRANDIEQSRIVNTHTDTAIRPVAVVVINDQRINNARFGVQFDLVNPSGETMYRHRVRPLFKLGRNIVVPQNSEFAVNKTTTTGTWSLRIWAGEYQWGELFFPITTRMMDTLVDTVSTDMEMSDGTLARANQLASQFSIDELLNS